MTYDQLLAFFAVAAEGSFTAASATLHKSQPAVSKLVRNLEGELGIELFDRTAYRATLTDGGRLFYDRAAGVIERMEALRTYGRGLAGTIEPIVRLAVDAVAPLAPILATLARVQAAYPTVRIELSTEHLAGAADGLQARGVDLAIATTLGIATATLDLAPFRRVRILPVARRDHPLARAGRRIPPALLRSHAQIVLSDSAERTGGPSVNVLDGGLAWRVTDVAAKKEIILAGMGWGGLPEHAIADEVAAGTLVPLAVPEFRTTVMELVVARRRDRPHGVVASALFEALQGQVARPRRRVRALPITSRVT